jgi:hypothetical protein
VAVDDTTPGLRRPLDDDQTDRDRAGGGGMTVSDIILRSEPGSGMPWMTISAAVRARSDTGRVTSSRRNHDVPVGADADGDA